MTRCFFLLFLLLSLLSATAAFAAPDKKIVPQLRRLSTSRTIGTETLRTGRALASFYLKRQFQPAWSDGHQLQPLADELIAALPAAAEEGLDPDDYHLAPLIDRSRRFRSTPTPQLAAELDLLLSDAFMALASHYLQGRIDPARVDHDWHIQREKPDPQLMLKQALTSGLIGGSLQALLPADPAYVALRAAWQDLRLLAANGGWPRLTLKPPLRPGATGPKVTALRQRLVISGDLPATAGSGESFDAELESALGRFQARHGLEADGVLGRQTLAALNVTAEERARQLAVNLERWRWLPRSFGERYLRVNVPGFHLEMVEFGQIVLEMRVIVGRLIRPTPAFVGRMTYLVLNPYWEVPNKLAVEDHLPKIRKNRAYLKKHDFTVFAAGNRRVNPDSIDWQQLGKGNFPYHLRQNPGKKNSLGRVKFIFPNPYAVYLHDTPARELFDREQRSFSSGCIRIEKPLELALLLLRGTPLDSPAALDEALESAVSRTITLPDPIPVYLVYFTAWVDSNGTINFRPDLYNRDPGLDAALFQGKFQ